MEIFTKDDMLCTISGKIMLNPVLTPEGYYVEYFEQIKKDISILKKNGDYIYLNSYNDYSTVMPCKIMLEAITSYLIKNPKERIHQYRLEEFDNDILEFLLYTQTNNINRPTNQFQNAMNYLCRFSNFTLKIRQFDSKLMTLLEKQEIIKHIIQCNQHKVNIKFEATHVPNYPDSHIAYTYCTLLPWESFNIIIQTMTKEQLFISLPDNSNLLHILATQENTFAIKFLHDIGVNFNQINDKKETPLHLACKKPKNARVIKYLILNGSNPYIVDYKGNTCFHHIVNYQLFMSIQYYLNNLDDPTVLQIKNKDGHDIFDLLDFRGRIDLVREIKEKYHLEQTAKKRRTSTSC